MHGLFAPSFDKPPLLQTARLGRRHAQFARPRLPATDRLFWALLPDPDTAAQIAELAERERRAHGLRGKPLQTQHFHVTLHHMGDAAEPPPPKLIDAIAERASGLVMPPFKVAFDRVMSFRNGAFVLSGDESLIGVYVLQHRLSDVLRAPLEPVRPFNPHVTLLRDGRQHVAAQPIEPVSWTAREVVLVHSLLGRTTHRHVARIPFA